MRAPASGMRESTMRFDARPGGATTGGAGGLGMAGVADGVGEGAVGRIGDEVVGGDGGSTAVSRGEAVGVEEASARAAGVVAVKLAPATCRARRTAAICVRAMAHAALAGVLVADGPMIAREAAASALTSLLRRVRSGPERAPRDAVLADLRERGFDADLARLANGGDIRATAVVRSAARFLSRALLSRARRDAV